MAIISNQQYACLRPWYHRASVTNMIACGNVGKKPLAYFLSYALYLRQ